MSAYGTFGWRVDLDGGLAESDDARVEFERADTHVCVYIVRPKRGDVDERWAAAIAAAAQAAIERALQPED